jgi:hypothetical protein
VASEKPIKYLVATLEETSYLKDLSVSGNTTLKWIHLSQARTDISQQSRELPGFIKGVKILTTRMAISFWQNYA